MILESIVEEKRKEVERAKAATPLAVLERRGAKLPPTRDFAGALAARETAVIAEVKRRSPSRGVLREGLDPAALARAYEASGAAAVSVLTDRPFFGGSNEDLVAVKEAVRLPVLRKEFVIDPWQIAEARAIGSDAILLIAALLSEQELRAFRENGAALGMAALVEVHDRGELEKALASGATIVGINNRDLRTFVTDIGTSLALAPLVPKGRIIVGESGIRDRRDIAALAGAGIRAFLVGETLVTAADPGQALKELLGP